MSLAKKINGEKKPRIETQESLQQFISKNNLDIDLSRNLFLKSKESKAKIANSKVGFMSRDNSLLAHDIYLFDENWKHLQHTNLLEGCLVDEVVADDFYEKVIQVNTHINSKINLSEFKGSFIDYNGDNFFPFQKNGKSVAIIVWAKYKGKMWARETNHIIRMLKQSEVDYDIYYLNLDPNEFYSQF